MAHARISGNAAEGSLTDVFISADLGGFDLRQMPSNLRPSGHKSGL